jgi:hypothetical protein
MGDCYAMPGLSISVSVFIAAVCVVLQRVGRCGARIVTREEAGA